MHLFRRAVIFVDQQYFFSVHVMKNSSDDLRVPLQVPTAGTIRHAVIGNVWHGWRKLKFAFTGDYPLRPRIPAPRLPRDIRGILAEQIKTKE